MSFPIPEYRSPLRDVASGFESGMNSIAAGLLRARESKEMRDADARTQAGSIINRAATEIASLSSVTNPSEDVLAQIEALKAMSEEAQAILSQQRPGDASSAWAEFSRRNNIAGSLGTASGVAEQAARTQREVDSIREGNAQLLSELRSFIANPNIGDQNFLVRLETNIATARVLMDSDFDLPESGLRTLAALSSGLDAMASSLQNNPDYMKYVGELRSISEAAARRAGLEVELTEEQLGALRDQREREQWVFNREQRFASVQDATMANGLVNEAVQRGDIGTLSAILAEIEDPDSERGRWYREAGWTAERIEAEVAEASLNLEWRNLNRQNAMAALQAGTARSIDELRDLAVKAHGSQGLDAWFNSLTPQEQANLGGPGVLANMKAQAAVYELGLQQPLRAEAWNQVNNILALPVPATADGFLTEEGRAIMQTRVQQIYDLMLPQFGQAYSLAFVEGAYELLNRNATTWEWDSLKTGANLQMVAAQTAAYFKQAGLDRFGNPIPVSNLGFIENGLKAVELIRSGSTERVRAISEGLSAGGCNPSMSGPVQMPGSNSELCQELRNELAAVNADLASAAEMSRMFGDMLIRGAGGELSSADFGVRIGRGEGEDEDDSDGGGADPFSGGGADRFGFDGADPNLYGTRGNVVNTAPVVGATDAGVLPEGATVRSIGGQRVAVSPAETPTGGPSPQPTPSTPEQSVVAADTVLAEGAQRIVNALPVRDPAKANEAATAAINSLTESLVPLGTRQTLGGGTAQPTTDQMNAAYGIAETLARSLGFTGQEPQVLSALNTFALNNYGFGFMVSSNTNVRGMNARVDVNQLQRLAELLQGTVNTVTGGAR